MGIHLSFIDIILTLINELRVFIIWIIRWLDSGDLIIINYI